ncbi:sn-glycerol-3-phosphate ABC transporter ATP-binding protein UgpC [Polyangium sp. y55x31]|uniref:ABC transporter ATP-binding protein n=1 Tax=Polyangium sp. y55x31 TaxID=3042688 RepID=UPI002482949F|nr:sn-glycerol-3-phosphate ABC transporter ATP-binding protein UgpC [Polyangium sp. y55x31]MDI1476848.1 sn-glycerol-3-phosphate ABC transporter ATP-binding protein UgpC [Polyangium sp. y55x31]
MASVTVTALKKKFGQTEVLKGVDVRVPEGHFAVLVGPSGCGKSTLLRLLAGLEEADTGKIELGDRDVTRLEPRDRNIAMVFQSYALYPHLTVRENLAFGLKLRKTDPAEIENQVKRASDMLGLGALLDRLPKQLSGGQRQRVAMGRAIVRKADLYLYDEPLSNLDAALRAQVRVDIRKLHDELGATSVYVTHDQVEAMTLADVIFVLNKGQVEQSGAPLEIFDRPATKFVAAFLGSPAMNFVEGALERAGSAWVFRANGLVVPVDEATFAGGLEPGRKVTLGVRPHEVALAEGGGETTKLVVTVVEALGPETYAHGEIAGAPFIARVEARRSIKKGETLPIVFRSIHLFDAATGTSLRAR